MEQALLISNAILWVMVIALAITVLALARQVGVLYERIAPAGALMVGHGPEVGDPAPVFEVDTLAGSRLKLGGNRDDARSTLLFFLSNSCPICETLIPVLHSIRKTEAAWLDVVLASDGTREEHELFVENKGIGEFDYVLSTQLGLGYQIGKLPYAVLIDGSGKISAKGLTNNREHLESLFTAKELGVASIQDYVHGKDVA
ncbi:MAG: methylamine dehydrogenase accessory protein MauD [Pseudomonadota bacterium]